MIERQPAVWMLEVAARTPDAVTSIACDLGEDRRHSIAVLAPDAEEKLLYASPESGMEDVLRAFAEGALRSVRIDFQAGDVDRLLLFAPNFCGSASSRWCLVVEQSRGDPLRTFKLAGRKPGLHFVALTADETMDDLPLQVDAETFPWDHPDLAIGAVYEASGEATTKLGPFLLPAR